MTHIKLLKKVGLLECIFGNHLIIEDNICGKCGLIK